MNKQITRVPENYTFRNERYKFYLKKHKKSEAINSLNELKKYGYKVIVVDIKVNPETTWWVVYRKEIPGFKTSKGQMIKRPSASSKKELVNYIERLLMMSPKNRLNKYQINTYQGIQYYYGYQVGALGGHSYVYMDGNDARWKDDGTIIKGRKISYFSKSDLIWILKSGPYWRDYCY